MPMRKIRTLVAASPCQINPVSQRRNAKWTPAASKGAISDCQV